MTFANGSRILSNKEDYSRFCARMFVPIFSQPWWMDAVCKPENWDVWLCWRGGQIVAAMPYYIEKRNGFRYITKAPLTQNNGIVFAHSQDSTALSRQRAEEKIIDEACKFIHGAGVDVYEQQYRYDFSNWSPFFWNGYEAIPRYTYVIEDTSDLASVEMNISGSYRKNIRKGIRNGFFRKGLDPVVFYREHEKVFLKQGLPCPFSIELWMRLYRAAKENNAGETLYAENEAGDITSLMFLVWDSRSAYLLLGGSMPEFRGMETYSMVIWESIKMAHEMGIAYDFEGSMIKRIAKSYRKYGGVPKQYFRIRKVFNPEIILQEARQKIERLEEHQGCSLEI